MWHNGLSVAPLSCNPCFWLKFWCWPVILLFFNYSLILTIWHLCLLSGHCVTTLNKLLTHSCHYRQAVWFASSLSQVVKGKSCDAVTLFCSTLGFIYCWGSRVKMEETHTPMYLLGHYFISLFTLMRILPLFRCSFDSRASSVSLVVDWSIWKMLRQRYCSVETRRASALIIMLIFSNHLTSRFVSITTSQSSFDFFFFFFWETSCWGFSCVRPSLWSHWH